MNNYCPVLRSKVSPLTNKKLIHVTYKLVVGKAQPVAESGGRVRELTKPVETGCYG